jgi:hypothetical protein
MVICLTLFYFQIHVELDGMYFEYFAIVDLNKSSSPKHTNIFVLSCWTCCQERSSSFSGMRSESDSLLQRHLRDFPQLKKLKGIATVEEVLYWTSFHDSLGNSSQFIESEGFG